MKITTKISLGLIAAPIVMAASLGFGGAAHADVMLSDLYTVDGVDYPECATEDCSDQPYGVGVWEDKDTGNWYFTTPEFSTLIVDDTTD